jgi:hypothetical protein
MAKRVRSGMAKRVRASIAKVRPECCWAWYRNRKKKFFAGVRAKIERKRKNCQVFRDRGVRVH